MEKSRSARRVFAACQPSARRRRSISKIAFSRSRHFASSGRRAAAMEISISISASVLGGALKGAADISLVGARPGYDASVAVENVDFASLTKLYFDYDNSRGRLNGRYEFGGRGDDGRAMEGRGELSVSEGNIFA